MSENDKIDWLVADRILEAAPATAFVCSVVHACPSLVAVLQDHLRDEEGVILAHGLMGGIRDFVERNWGQDSLPDEELQALFAALEQGLHTQNALVQDVVGVSFLWGLEQHVVEGLGDLAGPVTMQHFRFHENRPRNPSIRPEDL